MTRAGAQAQPRASAPAAGPVRAPRRRWAEARDRGGVVLAQLSLIGGFLVLWEVAATNGLINARLLSRPSLVVERIVELAQGAETYGNSTIWNHILVTLQELVPGYLAGSGIGLLVGFIFARSAITAAVLEPYILGIYSIPKIALAPLFILFFGIGIASKIAIVIVGVFFMVFFNTYAGVASVSEEYVNLARIMGADRRTVLRRVVLPSAMPAILTGFKMAVPFAMIGAIVGEFIASFEGLGFFIKQATVLFDASALMAGIFFLVLMTWVISQVVGLTEDRLLRWHPRRAREVVAA